MKFLSNKHFWGGVVVGYLLVVLVPQLNVRAMGVKASVGR